MTTPVFNPPSTNPFGLTNVGTYASPTFADINGDSKLDAIIGNRNGDTQVFLNAGTATAPSFAAPLTNPYGLAHVNKYAAPTFADINGDGKLDAIIGNQNGDTQVFLNTGTAIAPVFAAPLTNPFGLANVGSYAHPTFADINGDGKLDAIIGNSAGNTLVFLNTGTAIAPVFAAPLINPYGLTNTGTFAAPTITDINGDGKLDAIIGNRNGDTQVFLNIGTAIAPVFAAPLTNPFGLANVGSYASPTFADINGDSKLDAIIGNRNGDTQVFLNAAPAPAALPPAPPTDNTYIVHNTNINPDFTVNYAMGDQVVDTPNIGNDTVIADASYALAANIENLILAGNAVVGVGNDLNNVITGNALDNILNGGGGANTLAGGAGNDFYFVASSADVIIEQPNQGIDTVFSTANNYTLSDNIENLIIWGTGLNGTGNAGNNIIYGNALNNTLADGAGSDVLVGKEGKDTYNLSVDNTTDTLLISAGDSLTSSYDVVNNFNLGATGTDRLDLPTTQIATDTPTVGSAIAGSSITGASISNGIISFQGVGGAAIAAGTVSLADAIAYVQANIVDGNTVAFVVGTDTFVFQDGGANDTLVDLVGVAATSISNTNAVAGGAVWIV